ncbi:hypothetical protein GCM10029976_016770 [Kribbella albertanoniae]|uniref:Uncharacterized protein n=1 Tax=Kribbella albertanoniae TaxID=1266829 RepID=A0A4R4Q6L7_9ACTN|nr:hypothetical protein [Kribbella albertanoniae]TDC30881.1 hypothetical protein E1261_12075 [Kribbella albertanoniae]
MVSQADDADARQAGETLAANKLRPQDFRLMGFAVAAAQLVVLAPTWLTVRDGGHLDVYSGIGWFTSEGSGSPMVALRLFLLIAYIALVVMALVSSRTTGLALVRAPVGLVVTGLMLIFKPDSSESEVHWTGAPVIALALWVVAIVVAETGSPEAGRVRSN